jgi:hypothetical protein
MHNPNLPAGQRLAFRECGLSLGLRVLMKLKKKPIETDLNRFIYLADEIEEFWMNPKHQNSATWTEHLNINAVSLAASLVGM